MTEIYCEFTERVESCVLARKQKSLFDAVEEIRRIVVEELADRVDVGVARTFPSRSSSATAFVEFFFEESSIRNQLSRTIEAEGESRGLLVHVDHNTLMLQRRLDAVAFAADPRAVMEALRDDLPNIPLSFRAAGIDGEGVSRYAVIAHNVSHVENFNDREVMNAVDGILTRRFLASGAYRRYARS